MSKQKLISSVLTISVVGLFIGNWWLWGDKYKRGKSHGEQIIELTEELEKQNSQLLTVSIPYRQKRWKESSSRLQKIRRRVSGQTTLTGINSRTKDILSLRHEFKKLKPEHFRDPVHLNAEGSKVLAKELKQKIDRLLPENTDNKPYLLVGDCYSEDLVSGLSLIDPSGTYKAVRAYADANQAMNLLFKFQEQHLNEPAIVIWLRPEFFLAYHDVKPIQYDPITTNTIEKISVQNIKIQDSLTYDSYTWHKIKPQLLYPNALVEIPAELEGESVILVAWSAKERTPTGIEALKTGDQIFGEVILYDQYIANHQEIAGAYYWEKMEDDYTTPRYWLGDWVRSDYTGKNAKQKAGAKD